MNNDIYKRLIVAQMAMEGISTSTIQFFLSVFPSLVDKGYLSGKDMAELSSMSSQAASKHLRMLTRFGYMYRRSYKSWAFKDNALKDFHLIKLLRYTNAA